MKTKTPDWVKDSIFYQIFVDRFYDGNETNNYKKNSNWGEIPSRESFYGGDLEGIIAKLPYLIDLGIDAIYLTPIFKAPSNHKYDTEDYMSIDTSFGDIRIFKELLKIAHNNNIKIVIDGVFNHTGEQFWAFKDIKKNKEKSPYINWYFVESLPIVKKPKPNYKIFADAEFLPKLNVENAEVKKYIFDIVEFWTKTGIDGWRLDVPFEIGNHDFWKEFRNIIKSINSDAYLVGEIWENAKPWLSWNEFDGAMNYRLLELIKSYFVKMESTSEYFEKEINLLIKDYGWEITQTMLNLLDSHDTKRFLSLCQNNLEKFKLALTFIMAFPGVPMIYYGDEVGITGDNDPDCRRTMVWDKRKQDDRILSFYKKLIHLRKKHPALRKGSFETLCAGNGIFSFYRKYDKELIVVIFNRDNETYRELELELEIENSIKFCEDILTNKKYKICENKLLIPIITNNSSMILKGLY